MDKEKYKGDQESNEERSKQKGKNVELDEEGTHDTRQKELNAVNLDFDENYYKEKIEILISWSKCMK